MRGGRCIGNAEIFEDGFANRLDELLGGSNNSGRVLLDVGKHSVKVLLDHARIAKQAKITESEVASCGERAGEVPRIVKWKTIALETPHDVVGRAQASSHLAG